MKMKITAIIAVLITMTAALTACDATGTVSAKSNKEVFAEEADAASTLPGDAASAEKKVLNGANPANNAEGTGNDADTDTDTGNVASADDIDPENLFTDRDLEQSPDLSDAESLTVESGKDLTIDTAGTYVLSGQAEGSSVIIEASEEDKVQLVLDGLTVTNKDTPCIYVKSADKVFITLQGDANSLSVTGDFTADGDTNTDAVIFSKEDLVINGTGFLTITSSDNGIACKDDLKVTGGSLKISCKGSALESKDDILIADGSIEIAECNDGLHAEDDDNDSKGYIYIGGGSLNINAADDAIHATTVVRIDGGEMSLTAGEGIEGTVLCINGGEISIDASDDGINAAHKSSILTPVFIMNDGKVTIKMAQGDTDGIDSNGDIIINGGTIDITGQFTFDCDGKAEVNGGTIIENGVETNTVTNQMMGGRGGMGGFKMQGDPGAMGNPNEAGEMEQFGEPGEMRPFGGRGKMRPPMEGEQPEQITQ
ncbi:MAG: carbohydrate-binding domain-containing protein [Lachnospiraceae bacterium]|nr:carbohydrate-binding domain-containing protein [Lachnospiraceae bacterium]